MASLLTMASYGKSLTWTGGGNNSYWSASANWGGLGTPANGDSLTFPAGTVRLMNTNDLSNLSLANLKFAAGAINYELYGNAISLTGGLSAAYTGGQNTVGVTAITLTASQSIDCTATGASLSIKSTITNGVFMLTNNVGGMVFLNGNIYGTSGGVVKNGTGTLTYAGPNDNSYAGTTYVNAGTLNLNVGGYNAFTGPLVLGDGSGAGSPTVRLLQSQELPATSITVNTGGLLDLNGYGDTIGNSLTLNGNAGVQTGTGILNLPSNSTITAGAGNPSISGNLNIASGTCSIVANGNLTILANVSGSADIIKSGAQSVQLSGANSYTGLTVVQQGYVYAQNALALGATNGGTVVSNGATLVLSGSIGITNETLTLNGPGVSSYWGALDVEDSPGTNIWAGPVIVNADSTMDPYYANSGLRIIGPISGAGGVIELGAANGTLSFEGANANTFAGSTVVKGGTLLLGKTSGISAIGAGTFTIGDGVGPANSTVVRELGNSQIFSAPVVINSDGLLDLNGHNDIIGPTVTLNGGANILDTSAGTLTLKDGTTLAVVSGTSTISGNLNVGSGTCAWSQSSGTLMMNASVSGSANIANGGNGGVYLLASNSFTGTFTLNSGFLGVWNSWALGAASGGTIVNGTGTLGICCGGVNVGGEALALNTSTGYASDGALLVNGGSNSWAGPITLNSNAVVAISSNCVLTVLGSISGPGGFTKTQPGTLTLSGPDNSSIYTGSTTVNEGLLQLNSYNVIRYGTLIVGDGVGGPNVDIVRYLKSYCIYGGPGGAQGVINKTGWLDLNGFSDDVGPLTMDGGNITTGAGSLQIFPPVTTLQSSNGSSSISGNVTLTQDTTFNTGNSLMVAASVGSISPYSLTKNGPGDLHLMSSNSYTGLTVVEQGILWAKNAWALGATNHGTVVSNAATLALWGNFGITNEALVLNGHGVDNWGALDAESNPGTNVWAGPITVNADSTLAPYWAGTVLRIIGPINGAGGVQLFGSGQLSYEGASANTYVGSTVVPNGTLFLNKPAYNGAIPQSLSISGTVRLLANNQIADTADVFVQGGGLLDFGVFNDSIDTLNGSGTVNFGIGGWIYLGLNGGTSQFDGSFTGIGYAPGWTVGKTGTGTFTMTGNNTFSAGVTHVVNGKMVINGAQPQSPVIVDSGATLGGNGTVGHVTCAGVLSPGAGPGVLTTSNVTFTTSGAYMVDLNGPVAGAGYDQLNVRGTAVLAGASLQVNSSGLTPAQGQPFVIINNDGNDAMAGTFGGLPEGALMSVGALQFSVTYHGGDGNDVALISTNTQPPSSNGVAYWINPAGGFWSNPNNWSFGRAPLLPTDDVFISLEGDYSVILDVDVTNHSLVVGGTSFLGVSGLVISNHILGVNGPIMVSEMGRLELDSGSLNGSGPLLVDGTMSWNSGRVSKDMMVNGQLQMAGDGIKQLKAARMDNHGTIVLAGPGLLDLGDGAGINNYGGFMFPTDGLLSQSGLPASVFTNAGWIRLGSGGMPTRKDDPAAKGTSGANGNFSAAHVTMKCSFVQTPVGTIECGIYGPGSNQWDRLILRTNAVLDGGLMVGYRSDSLPSPGDQFELLSYGPRQGEFAWFNGPDFLVTSYQSNDLILLASLPVFTTQPQSQTVLALKEVVFQTEVSTPFYLFEWFFNDALLEWATAPALVLESVNPAQSGAYYAVAWNGLGASTSQVAILTVQTNWVVLSGCPSNRVVPSMAGLCGAVVNWNEPTVWSALGWARLTSNYHPGEMFPIGTTTVIYEAVDDGGNRAQCAFAVTVLDGEPPAIICPADFTFESTNSGGSLLGTGVTEGLSYVDVGYSNRVGGNVVNYGVTASDNCAVSNLTCLPPSGTPFAVGVSRVYCLATDSAGLSANCSFTITVTDTTAPTLSCPGMLLVYVPSGLCETNVEFPVTAWDNGTPAPLVACLPPSGTFMGVGQTNVTCVARDAIGNTASCAFPVLIYPQSADHQPPVILGAANQVREATGPTEVYFNVTATNACQPDIPVICDPPSGSVFPLGVTPVFCVAVDAFNVTNTASFTVALGSFSPPGILRPPVSQVVCLGSDCKFVVLAQGSPPLVYQWLFNGVELRGATNSVLVLSNVPSFLAGRYKVEVSNPSGQVTSDDAFLTVNQPATITAQPQSLVVGTGDSATFTVGAEGTPPLTYQWYRDGRLMRGATNAQLLVADAHNLGASPTSYQVVVQNYCGKDTSDKVTLNVIAKPTIITQPQSVHYVCRPPNALAYNPYVRFTVMAGGDNLKYQWYHGTSVISPGLNPWASQPTLFLTNVSPADAGPYHVQVWNDVGGAAGGLVSAEAWLDVLAILSQPQGATNFPGSNVVLAVEAFANNLQYQWTHNGFLIDGATNPVLTITNLGPTNAGAYQVTVLDNWDSLPSDLAMVSVLYPTLPFADFFTDRGMITNGSGTGIGNNVGATKEPGETNHAGRIGGHSVWLTWVAPDDGVATFDTIGSSFDTVLAVYTGNDLSSLAGVASDDDLGGFHWSRVMFNAQAGFSYEIAVDSADQTVKGNIMLGWHLRQTLNLIPAKIVPARSLTVPPLATTNLCLSFGSVSGTSPVLMQWYRDDQPVGLTASNQNQSCLPFAQVTETNVGIYQAGIFRGTDLQYFLEPVEVQINTEGLNVAARKKLEDAKLLGLIGMPYPDSDLGGTNGATNLIVQPKSIAKSIPKDWAPVSGYSGGQIFATSTGKAPYEPYACGVGGGASYWFSYQPPEDGLLTLNTDGSSYDTVIGVYYDDGLGNGFDSFHEVACDNDSGTTHFSPPPAATSALTFLASHSTNYYIMVDGVSGAYGTVHLNYSLNTLPRIGSFATPQTIDQDTSTSALSFTNCDRETAVGSLVLTGTSSDVVLVPTANIVFGGSGTNRTVTVTPAAHRFGTNTITITVTDGGGAGRSNSFTLRVVRVNHPPQPVTDTVVRLPNRTISIALAALLRNDTDPDGDPVTLTAVSARSQSGGFVTKGATFITYTPPAGFNSTDRFTYTVSDDQGGTATGAVYINVSSTTGQTTVY